MRRAVLLGVCLVLVSCPAARAQYAPVNQPGPPLAVPAAALAASLSCSGRVDHATRAPVLLIPGTASLAHLKDNLAAEDVVLDDQARIWTGGGTVTRVQGDVGID